MPHANCTRLLDGALAEETIIVKGLPSKVTEEAIKTAFSAYGQVNHVKIVDQYDARYW